MKIIDQNGKRFYAWDENEGNAKKVFEDALSMVDSLKVVMDALLESVGRKKIDARTVWEDVHDKIKEVDPNYNRDDSVIYHWVSGRFEVKK